MSAPLVNQVDAEGDGDHGKCSTRCLVALDALGLAVVGMSYGDWKRQDKLLFTAMFIIFIICLIGAASYWTYKVLEGRHSPASSYYEEDFKDNIMSPVMTIAPLFDTTADYINDNYKCWLAETMLLEYAWNHFVEVPLKWTQVKTPNEGVNFSFATMELPFNFSFDPKYDTVGFKFKQPEAYNCFFQRGDTPEQVDCPTDAYEVSLWGENLNDIFTCTWSNDTMAEPPEVHVPAFFIIPNATGDDLFKDYVASLNRDVQKRKAKKGIRIASTNEPDKCLHDYECLNNPASFLANAFPRGVSVMAGGGEHQQTIRYSVMQTEMVQHTIFGTHKIPSDQITITVAPMRQSLQRLDRKGGLSFTADTKVKKRVLSPSPDPFTALSSWFTMAHSMFTVMLAIILIKPPVVSKPRWRKEKSQADLECQN